MSFYFTNYSQFIKLNTPWNKNEKVNMTQISLKKTKLSLKKRHVIVDVDFVLVVVSHFFLSMKIFVDVSGEILKCKWSWLQIMCNLKSMELKAFIFIDLNLKRRSVTNQFEFIFENFLMTHKFAFHIRYTV